MSSSAAHLIQVISDAFRSAVWMLVSGFVILGATYYGGIGVYRAWQNTHPPASRRSRNTDIAREAEKGIAEIEAFLAAQPSATDPPTPPPTSGRRRRTPPGESA